MFAVCILNRRHYLWLYGVLSCLAFITELNRGRIRWDLCWLTFTLFMGTRGLFNLKKTPLKGCKVVIVSHYWPMCVSQIQLLIKEKDLTRFVIILWSSVEIMNEIRTQNAELVSEVNFYPLFLNKLSVYEQRNTKRIFIFWYYCHGV